MATNLTLQKYKDLANQLQADLYSTPGISSPGSVPSSSDVQKEAQFIKTKAGLQRVLSEQRADDWYRTPSLAATKKESKREGLVSRIINILSKFEIFIFDYLQEALVLVFSLFFLMFFIKFYRELCCVTDKKSVKR